MCHPPLGLAIHPIFYPMNSAPVQGMSSQFLQESAAGNSVKGFTEVQVGNIQPFPYVLSRSIIKDQVSQGRLAFPKLMLPGPDPLVVLLVPCHDTQDDLLHDLPQH